MIVSVDKLEAFKKTLNGQTVESTVLATARGTSGTTITWKVPAGAPVPQMGDVFDIQITPWPATATAEQAG